MTTLYEKRGRRYVPAMNVGWESRDEMRVGEFRLTYCYSNGGRRYSYEVRPDTASFVAAAMVAKEAMERAMQEAVVGRPAESRKFTPRQLALLDEFRKRASEIGMLFPEWWAHGSPREVAEAGIRAVREFAP